MASGNPLPRIAIGGYSIVEAPDVDAATAILRTHPFVARGGTFRVDAVVSV